MIKLKGKKTIKLAVIVITVLIIAMLLLLVGKEKGITILNFNISKIEENTGGLTVKYLDVDTTILIFEYPQGIKSIKASYGNEINCNGKNRIAIDLKIVPGTEYTFEVTDENNNVITEGFTGQSSYWLTYDLKGGSGQPEKQLKVSGQTLKLSDITPSAYIYQFKGWSTDPNATEGTYQPGDNFEENEPVVLYAIWGKNWANITDLKTQANELEEGQHVMYNGVEYVVLYQYKDHETKYTQANGYAEDYGQYGAQLIATDVIKDASGNVEKVTIGGNNYSEAHASWDNWVTTLNAKAENYILEEDKASISGRCVGCHPNPSRIGESDNYSIDFNQMNKLGISGITTPFPLSYDYALAAKFTSSYGWTSTYIRYISIGGNLQEHHVTQSRGTTAKWFAEYHYFAKKEVGYRPVLIISPEVHVTERPNFPADSYSGGTNSSNGNQIRTTSQTSGYVGTMTFYKLTGSFNVPEGVNKIKIDWEAYETCLMGDGSNNTQYININGTRVMTKELEPNNSASGTVYVDVAGTTIQYEVGCGDIAGAYTNFTAYWGPDINLYEE